MRAKSPDKLCGNSSVTTVMENDSLLSKSEDVLHGNVVFAAVQRDIEPRAPSKHWRGERDDGASCLTVGPSVEL